MVEPAAETLHAMRERIDDQAEFFKGTRFEQRFRAEVAALDVALTRLRAQIAAEMAAALTGEWSEPVQVSIVDGEMVIRPAETEAGGG